MEKTRYALKQVSAENEAIQLEHDLRDRKQEVIDLTVILLGQSLLSDTQYSYPISL